MTIFVTDQGKLYLESVLDMGSRRIVGFALGEHHDAELATVALQIDGGRGPRPQTGTHPSLYCFARKRGPRLTGGPVVELMTI